jgi:hypothetical protein
VDPSLAPFERRKGGTKVVWLVVAILAVGWTLLNAKFGGSVRG